MKNRSGFLEHSRDEESSLADERSRRSTLPDVELPLSYAQQSLWLVQQTDAAAAVFNLAGELRLRGTVNVAELRRAFNQVVDRHPTLRTTYHTRDGVPVQTIHPKQTVDLALIDASGWAQKAVIDWEQAEAIRPFDLERGPIFRATLLARSAEEHVLFVVVHHIAVDFWSFQLLVNDLLALYAPSQDITARLPSLPDQYPDYVRWQQEMLESPQGERLWNYWKERLAGDLPVLQLPIDFQRPPIQTFEGASFHFDLGEELTDKLRALAKSHGATLYTTILGAFFVLLQRYSGQHDLIIGTPMIGRSRVRFKSVVGYFVNMIPIRMEFRGNPSFRTLLQQTRQSVSGAQAHREFPFSLLVQRLQPVRDPGRQSIFQVSFNWNQGLELKSDGPSDNDDQVDGTRPIVDRVSIESISAKQVGAPLDLMLMLSEGPGSVSGYFQYTTALFHPDTIERMAGHFRELLESIAADPDQPITALSLLTPTERKRLLHDWNATQTAYPLEQTLTSVFEYQVKTTPEDTALIEADERLCYGELNARVNRLAHHLQHLGVARDQRVAVCLPRSFDLIVSMLAVLKAGAAYMPLDPAYPTERLAFMLEDAAPTLLLTNGMLAERFSSAVCPILNLDQSELLLRRQSADNPTATADPDDPACLIYTSGSTGQPKGVLNSHRALLNTLYWQWEAYPYALGEVCCQKTALSFGDAVQELFAPLLAGIPVVLVPENVLSDPPSFVALLAQHRVTRVLLVPSLLRALLQSKSNLARALPDLRLWIAGGEALPVEIVQQLRDSCPDARVVNLYGQSEAAYDATAYEVGALESGALRVPIGRPIANTQVYVLDAHQQVVPIGVPGELWVGGVGVASGYWNRPELTAERFRIDQFSTTPGAQLYRTGDLCRWQADGVLEYLGRTDDQVKIRGVRIELGEVEAALRAHPAVQAAVVVAREDQPGDQRLVAYVTLRPSHEPPTASEFRRFLRSRLPDTMLPTSYVALERLPLTPSGKIDRRSLPMPERDRNQIEASFVAPRDPLEMTLASIWADVLGLDQVGIHDNFFDLGGHSMLATQIMNRVAVTQARPLELRTIFESPTVAELADRLRTAEAPQGTPVESVSVLSIPQTSRTNPLPLSYAQERLWSFEQIRPGSAAYNLPVALRVRGPLNTDALERSLNMVVSRHEVLRTRFPNNEGRPRQMIEDAMTVPITVNDLTTLPQDDRATVAQQRAITEARRPFDLATGPLLRLAIWRLADDDHLALLTMHHIVADGWSAGVLVREVVSLYDASRQGESGRLADLAVQYADYAVWQRQSLEDGGHAEHLAYWTEHLSGAPELLDLPTDYPRPAVATDHGDRVPISLDREFTDQVASFSRESGVTLYMTLLAAFQVLLSRYSGQDDLVVGSPIANRVRREIEPLIGFFVNTLVLRADLSGNPGFRQTVERVKEGCLQAYAHQDLPLEVLVDALHPARNLSYNPLFQVMFALQNAPDETLYLAGLSIESVNVGNGAALFDLSLTLTETADGLHGWLDFRTDLYERETIERFAEHYRVLLESALADPDEPISQLSLLTETEWQQLVTEWNDTARTFPLDQLVHEFMEDQVQRTPNATALVFEDQHLTYQELNRRANQLARYLRRLGAGTETVVGVCMERSLEQIVAVVAIAKAGAVYLPLDIMLPVERLRFMLEDSAASIVLTQASLRSILPRGEFQAVWLDRDWSSIAAESEENLGRLAGPNDLMYLIYTSGSTGQPKGVLIEHRSMTNYNLVALEMFRIDSTSRQLQLSTPSFDPSVSEIWRPLMVGAELHVARQAVLTSPQDLHALLQQSKITHFGPTASLLTVLPNDDLPDLQTIISGGDRVTWEVVQIWAPGQRLINGYGPTETTVTSTGYVCSADDPGDPPIGRPIANTRVYVVDKHQQLVPIGVPGELCIGGVGVARGYLNRPDLTAERFISDPFIGDPDAQLYRTGDQVRYRPDGNLEFLGRIDNQVKIRGFRVEPGEIEARLRQHSTIVDAVVMANTDASGTKMLVAYLVFNEDSERPASTQLRHFLLEILPDYMVPSVFVPLKELPLMANGKVDRRALPAPETDRAMLADPFVAPRTPIEEILAGIWADVLQVGQIGVHDNFFEVGGDSIRAIQIIARANQAGMNLKPQHLFQAQTVASLAELVEFTPTAEPSLVASEAPTPKVRPSDVGDFTPTDFPLADLDQERLDKLLIRLNRTKGNSQ